MGRRITQSTRSTAHVRPTQPRCCSAKSHRPVRRYSRVFLPTRCAPTEVPGRRDESAIWIAGAAVVIFVRSETRRKARRRPRVSRNLGLSSYLNYYDRVTLLSWIFLSLGIVRKRRGLPVFLTRSRIALSCSILTACTFSARHSNVRVIDRYLSCKPRFGRFRFLHRACLIVRKGSWAYALRVSRFK